MEHQSENKENAATNSSAPTTTQSSTKKPANVQVVVINARDSPLSPSKSLETGLHMDNVGEKTPKNVRNVRSATNDGAVFATPERTVKDAAAAAKSNRWEIRHVVHTCTFL